MKEFYNFNVLLKTGLFLGHHVRELEPMATMYMLGVRKDLVVVDSDFSKVYLSVLLYFVKSFYYLKQRFLFVNEKQDCNFFFRGIVEAYNQVAFEGPWIGGYLTNLKETAMLEKFQKKTYLKFHRASRRVKEKLMLNLRVTMLPSVLVNLHSLPNNLAIKEANRLLVPTFFLLDSNRNPLNVSYPIPGNDDSFEVSFLILKIFFSALAFQRQALSLEFFYPFFLIQKEYFVKPKFLARKFRKVYY
jgi:small subunit ribosomal protein S2